MSYQSYNAVTFGSLSAFLEDGTNGLYVKLEAMGWTLYNNIDGTATRTERIYKTTGEDGTEIGYIHVHQTSDTVIQILIGSYYPAAGAVVGGEGNEVGHTSYAGSIVWAAGNVVAWLGGDKDLVGFVMHQHPDYGNYVFGFPKRRIPTQQSGRTTLSADATIAAYGNTTITVGSITNLTVGQKLFIVNVGSGHKGTIVRCTIQAIGAGTLDVSNDSSTATDFDSGALVGLDPMPMCLFMGDGTYRGAAASWGLAFIYDPATKRLTGTDQFTPTHVCVAGDPGYMGGTFGSGYKTLLYNYVDPSTISVIYGVFPWVLFGHWNANTAGAVAFGEQCRGVITRFVQAPPAGTVFAGEDTLTDGTTVWLVAPDKYANFFALISKYPALRTVA